MNGVKVLTQRVDPADAKAYRALADQLRDKLRLGVVVVWGEKDGKGLVLVGATKDIVARGLQRGRGHPRGGEGGRRVGGREARPGPGRWGGSSAARRRGGEAGGLRPRLGLGKGADSGHLCASPMSAPTPLRVRLPFRSEDEFVDQYGAHVGRDGFFLATRAPKPVGAQLLFDLVLADGSSLLRGEGVVVRSSASGERPGMTLRFVRLEAAGKALVERIVSGRPARGGAPAEARAHPSAWAAPAGPACGRPPARRDTAPRPAGFHDWAPPAAPPGPQPAAAPAAAPDGARRDSGRRGVGLRRPRCRRPQGVDSSRRRCRRPPEVSTPARGGRCRQAGRGVDSGAPRCPPRCQTPRRPTPRRPRLQTACLRPLSPPRSRRAECMPPRP